MNLFKDWDKLLKDDDFQQDLIFLIYITILLMFNVIPNETFSMLAAVIIGGDAVKKLGRGK
jgi:hypothetical protein